MPDQPTGEGADLGNTAQDPLLIKIKGLVGASHGKLKDPDYQNAISAALARYSGDLQMLVAVDIAGTGSHDYDLPVAWVDGFSEVSQIEYPVGQVPEALLDKNDYALYLTPTGTKLRLLYAAPNATESLRITFPVLRTTGDINDNDLDAFAALAASICFEMLAGIYVGSTDPTIQADAVNYRSKSGEAAARAKALFKLYKIQMNIPDDDDMPAAAVVGSNQLNYPGGIDRLTHPRRYRNLR